MDASGSAYVGGGNRIRVIDSDGSQWVIAGSGQAGFKGDRDRALAADLSVSGMAADRFGSVWFTDPVNRRARVLAPARYPK